MLEDLQASAPDVRIGLSRAGVRGAVKAIRVKNAATLSRSQIDRFTEIAKQEGAGGLGSEALTRDRRMPLPAPSFA